MHTYNFKEKETDTAVIINYNGDYSGDITISVLHDGQPYRSFTIEVPFEAIKSFMNEYIRDRLMSKIENAEEDLIEKLLK